MSDIDATSELIDRFHMVSEEVVASFRADPWDAERSRRAIQEQKAIQAELERRLPPQSNPI